MTSCATSQTDHPVVTNRVVKASGTMETEYKFPGNYSTEDVRIRFLGMETFYREDGIKIPAIHIILSASNLDKGSDLTIESKDLSVSSQNGKQLQLLSANPATMVVRPGGHFGMDLYFAITKELAGSDSIDLHWKVKSRDLTYAKTTTFELAQTAENQPDWNLYSPLSGMMFGPTAGLFN